jgi:hypothetical protein
MSTVDWSYSGHTSRRQGDDCIAGQDRRGRCLGSVGIEKHYWRRLASLGGGGVVADSVAIGLDSHRRRMEEG